MNQTGELKENRRFKEYPGSGKSIESPAFSQKHLKKLNPLRASGTR
jgi:hypothetical protein